MKLSDIRKSCISFGILFVSCLCLSNNAAAVNAFDLALGVERMEGDTTYQIGGNIIYTDGSQGVIQFPVSELEWPLDIWLGRLDASMNIGSSWRINGVIKKNISDPDGKMKDSDWGINYLSGVPGALSTDLDIYSESNISNFEALIFDLDVEWVYIQRGPWNFFAGLGYQYQNFDYDSNMIEQQMYYRGSPVGSTMGDGSVSITYDITYRMLYALIGADVDLADNFTLSGSFAYAPWVDAEDKDVHVWRNRVADGDMDGDAYMFDLSLRYNLNPNWFMVAGAHYTKIDVDGTTKISTNGLPVISSEEETSESTQTSGFFKIGFTF